ncbi:DUF4270 domain-containing protein [Prevotella ihumii]|uniref:DUF4270 domain-containing protein n=1 Tax=Prevotella ihumii TaxID=1917878 RepID=UPI000980EF05|nr:DUF4270 domain-containing protein [Prevotella ihumii]
MKSKLLMLALVLCTFGIISCDDTTNELGGSLTGEVDNLKIKADTFNVGSKSIFAPDMIAHSSRGFLGQVKDPETNTYITANYMSQFNVLKNYQMIDNQKIVSRDAEDKVVADSCQLILYYNNHYGDSTAQLKMTVYELQKPVEEGRIYPSSFSPLAEGYVRNGGIAVEQSYTLSAANISDSLKADKKYAPHIRVKMYGAYTDKSGTTYNNYGTYIMRKYYENQANFRNAYQFLHEVCPGFFFKITSGLGSMAQVSAAQLVVFYRYKDGEKIKNGTTSFTGTEEVLQLTNFDVDQTQMQRLANIQGSSYIKTPAGLFTEFTLPIAEVLRGHETDTINSAKIELKRMINETNSAYTLDVPKHLLILPSDSLASFFKKGKNIDNKTSYIAHYDASANNYVFNNIAGIVNLFAKTRNTASNTANWGKVVVVPVDVHTTKTSDGQTAINKISLFMGLSSAKLLGGDAATGNIKMSVVYSKFNGR